MTSPGVLRPTSVTVIRLLRADSHQGNVIGITHGSPVHIGSSCTFVLVHEPKLTGDATEVARVEVHHITGATWLSSALFVRVKQPKQKFQLQQFVRQRVPQLCALTKSGSFTATFRTTEHRPPCAFNYTSWLLCDLQRICVARVITMAERKQMHAKWVTANMIIDKTQKLCPTAIKSIAAALLLANSSVASALVVLAQNCSSQSRTDNRLAQICTRSGVLTQLTAPTSTTIHCAHCRMLLSHDRYRICMHLFYCQA